MHSWSCRVHFKQTNSKTGAYELIILCDQHLKQMLLSNERLLFIEPNLVVLLLPDCIARLLGFKPKFQNKYDLKTNFKTYLKLVLCHCLFYFIPSDQANSKWPLGFVSKIVSVALYKNPEKIWIQTVLKSFEIDSWICKQKKKRRKEIEKGRRHLSCPTTESSH